MSVTIPFKEEIIPLIDELDPQAARIGAVNTVVNRDGRLMRLQHRLAGGLERLKGQNRPEGRARPPPGGRRRRPGHRLRHSGGRRAGHPDRRGRPRAAALARDLKVEAIPLDAVAQCPAAILVNATPVGMEPKADDIPIDPDLLGRYRLVMDIVYKPLETRLLREAKARGVATIDGLQMLIHQATAQFELWTGKTAPLEIMSRAAYAALG